MSAGSPTLSSQRAAASGDPAAFRLIMEVQEAYVRAYGKLLLAWEAAHPTGQQSSAGNAGAISDFISLV